ncbi:MAG: sigma-70 family RNA polymerase sigma factor [Lachnospiraceae bacterium]|nr:sigma-70 family RNA polymerase sigma factor [Lachnospiraceae bacterium]
MIFKVKRAQHGDTKAFVELMEENRQAMQRIAFGYFSCEDDVADVMQQTALNVFEKLSTLKNPVYFKTWLIRIHINNCNTLYNTKKSCTVAEELEEGRYLEEYPSEDEFYQLIAGLSEDNRLIFQLYYGEEYTTKEIGRILNMKESTVRSRLHRGKEQIKRNLETSVR